MAYSEKLRSGEAESGEEEKWRSGDGMRDRRGDPRLPDHTHATVWERKYQAAEIRNFLIELISFNFIDFSASIS